MSQQLPNKVSCPSSSVFVSIFFSFPHLLLATIRRARLLDVLHLGREMPRIWTPTITAATGQKAPGPPRLAVPGHDHGSVSVNISAINPNRHQCLRRASGEGTRDKRWRGRCSRAGPSGKRRCRLGAL
ncbi:hypothetical protein QBC34DRAFT_404198 [Podospora aff. communis PSN243]|uniref:Uncharacterized protein n=1 Tax=Podospora aff. communis PSN243 TaxID=3040156 RepID=A0AAV9GRD3_9PEZI|nr:hypothetical protein QBC34DRAFT_404198 [Podospora aff. communis PSN243]